MGTGSISSVAFRFTTLSVAFALLLGGREFVKRLEREYVASRAALTDLGYVKQANSLTGGI